MPYEAPTVEQLIERFPELATADPDQLEAAIVRANRQVDETWLEDDYQEAIMQLAAHIYSSMAASEEGFGQDDIRSLTIGPLSLAYGGKISDIDLTTTIYGQGFVSLRRRNIPAVLVI